VQSAFTTSVFSAARPVSAIRLSAYAETSTGSPFSVISCTVASTRSANVEAPGSRQLKAIVVVEPKVVSPVVRSRSMEYDATSRRAARVAASSRVRLVPGMR
jgi:hypothetical protein